MTAKKIDVFIDGASVGNPGPAGVGVIVCEDGQVLKNLSKFIGETTNNVAEYMALIFALQEALIMRIDYLVVNTDSQLLANQISGDYKVKNSNLKLLYEQARHLISGFKDFKIRYIPRTENKGADKLATLAIKNSKKRVL
ncbi:MAG: ribonuclease HI family protein [Candidatus Omnitrophota bacterium]